MGEIDRCTHSNSPIAARPYKFSDNLYTYYHVRPPTVVVREAMLPGHETRSKF